MELEVYKIDGKKTAKKATLADTVFAVQPNDHAIYLDVKQYLANQRQGTHSAKEKSQLSGSTKKLKKQKGTGGARAGSIKSPLMKGGARVFGPRPRDYGFKLNKQLKTLARKSALSYKVKDNGVVVLEDFTFDVPKTKNYIDLLKSFKLNEKKTLLVLPANNKSILLSLRNLKKAKVALASSLNTYDIMNAQHLLLVESSIKEIERINA